MKYVHTKFEDHWPRRMLVIRVNVSLHKNFNNDGDDDGDYNSSPYSSNSRAKNGISKLCHFAPFLMPPECHVFQPNSMP